MALEYSVSVYSWDILAVSKVLEAVQVDNESFDMEGDEL